MKYAIVDLGSNTIRLSLYNTLEDGNFETLFSKKEMAGLARYVNKGVMSREGILQACNTLSSFKLLLHKLGIEEMFVFATASLRNIKNTEEAVDLITNVTGLTPDIISGDDEGVLGYYGALGSFKLHSGIMFDIGGGSTEIVQIKNDSVVKSQSVSIGSLNLFSSTVSKLWPSNSELKEIESKIEKKLEDACFPSKKPDSVCCIGGTVRAILKIYNSYFKEAPDNCIMNVKNFKDIVTMISKRDPVTRSYVLKFCPDRIHTIIPGVLIMNNIIKHLNCKEINVSMSGVREGYLYKKFIKPSLKTISEN